MGRDNGTTARDGLSGRLAPWAEQVTGALGWQVTTPSRRLADIIAKTEGAGTVAAYEKGAWRAYIPRSVLAVTVTNADTAALQCTLCLHPNSDLFVLEFAPWPAATVLKCPVSALPTPGTLSVRDVRIKTRMGRIVRYLVPRFLPP